jgi:1-acyl-sn-glycerol-3-phosphate acyltransferase
MTLLRIVQFFLFLPFVYIKSLKIENHSFNDKYMILQNLCLKIISIWRIELKVNISSKVKREDTYYLVSNHQGTLDPIFLVAASPFPHSFISKEENLKIPIIGEWGRKIEFITFNRYEFEDNVQMLRQSMRFLKDKKSLLVFPEGTRSRSDKMLDLKAGAFLPAYGSKVSILPVTLQNSYKMDKFDSKVNEIIVTYHDPIQYEEYKTMSYQECADKVKDIIESVQ